MAEHVDHGVDAADMIEQQEDQGHVAPALLARGLQKTVEIEQTRLRRARRAGTEQDQPGRSRVPQTRHQRRRARRGAPLEPARAGDVRWLLENLSDAIGQARDKDVLIYVHGAKVNFYNACAFTAQLDHFMGRDMTSVAFSWPTRQNIFSYAFGSDVRRAYDSGAALATLIELLAMVTPARRIHVLCWSAGGRVTTRALTTLRERHPDEDEDD
ncbi:MAG: alpha/beta hydrolase, partial [Proteobacteria bacterium]|nr:alpha/beta hydrolase [Pseudomonadota bacterium]